MERRDLTRLLWTTVCQKYGMSWKRKDGANWFANLAGDALQALHIQSKQAFMETYVTTIILPTNTTVHAPFEPGEETPYFSLDAQDEVILHEAVHKIRAVKALEVGSFGALGSVGWDLAYLAQPAIRAHEEAMARQADVEWSKLRYGRVHDVLALAEQLRFYACTAEVPIVAAELASIARTVEAGGYSCGVVLEAAALFEQHAPHLLALRPPRA